jgi:glutaredoxin
MNRFSSITCLIIVFFFSFTKGYAVQDSLVLYTNPGCSNCKAVKQALQQSGIYYIEKSLEKNVFATEMLHKLSANGYHKEIYLPVILLNNKMYHPAYKSDTGLVSIPLQDVVDTLRNRFRRGELNVHGVNAAYSTNTTGSSSTNSDCQVKASPIYLVCSTFDTEAEAKAAMNKLISSGYTFAGIILYQNKFRVFSKFFYDQTSANSELNEMMKSFTNAYLFEMP